MKKSEPQLSIAAVEREVGLSKDVLRVWERRYGFPAPVRDRNDERLYPADQVRRLRLVKRLMDQGHRPGRLLASPADELERLASGAAPAARAARPAPARAGASGELIACLRSRDAAGIAGLLQTHLAREGLARFVQDIVAPLTAEVGEEWARGRIEVYEEHLFTEICARVLRQAIAAVPPGRAPTVLLTTPADESHALGLLMAESLLTLQGARCIALGTQMPLTDIARATERYRADVVALSFSSAFPARRVPQVLQELRAALPRSVEVWAGGAGVRRVQPAEGVRLLPELGDAAAAVQDWLARG